MPVTTTRNLAGLVQHDQYCDVCGEPADLLVDSGDRHHICAACDAAGATRQPGPKSPYSRETAAQTRIRAAYDGRMAAIAKAKAAKK